MEKVKLEADYAMFMRYAYRGKGNKVAIMLRGCTELAMDKRSLKDRLDNLKRQGLPCEVTEWALKNI